MDEAPTSPQEELALEQRARQGDAAAATDLLCRYRPRLVGFCRGYLHDGDDAEDAAQDVIARVVAAPWPTGGFRPWLYRVARNHCLNLLRRRCGGPVDYGGGFRTSGFLSPRTGPATALGRRERDGMIEAAMQSLAGPHAEVLFLRYFEDLDREEIAAVLGLKPSVVKSRLAHARRELALRMRRMVGRQTTD